jgi:hypothetical protein
MSPSDPLHEQMVAAERSLFGTRLPRPTGVGRHLFVVLVVSAVALGLAIYFAESGGGPPATPAPAAAR